MVMLWKEWGLAACPYSPLHGIILVQNSPKHIHFNAVSSNKGIFINIGWLETYITKFE